MISQQDWVDSNKMATFILTLGIIAIAFIALSLGVIVGRTPIKGSCGGLACVPGADCAACPNKNKRDTA